MLIDKSVKVSKEADELMVAIAAITKATKVALKDGFQPGQDLPAIVTVAFSQLLTAIDGIDKLPEEAKSELGALMRAASLGVVDVVEAALA